MATLSLSSALPNFEAASFVEAEWTKQEVFTGVSGLGQKVAEYMWLFCNHKMYKFVAASNFDTG